MDRKHVDELLNEIAEELSIPDSTFDNAVTSYSALGDYIDNHSDFSVEIYPQGSIRLGTLIKPINDDDDYDIDLVCLVGNTFYDAKDLKNAIGDILKSSDRYAKMLDEEGRRCWTLKYADDAHFHMDILPSQNDESKSDDSISITDRVDGMYSFKSSNPKGYAKWFDGIVGINSNFQENKVEPIKRGGKKSVLQKTIQLLKRHRDIMYSTMSEIDNADKPISIIITTIAARLFTGEESVLELLEKFADSWETCFEKDGNGNDFLSNPVDSNENFADKWIEEPNKKAAFVSWAKKLKEDLNEGNFPSFTDKVKEADSMKRIFGASLVENVYAQKISKINSPYIARSGNTVGITNEKTDISVKKHTFYGDD